MSSPSLLSAVAALNWSSSERALQFQNWLTQLPYAFDLSSLHIASSDASFRRYLRIKAAQQTEVQNSAQNKPQTWIVMDAPPDQENSSTFVAVAKLFSQAGLKVPQIFAWESSLGFMLLEDLGEKTMMEVLEPKNSQANLAIYSTAVDTLIALQSGSKPDVLPPYDAALLHRELALFPEWYVQAHRGITLGAEGLAQFEAIFNAIIAHNLQAPKVYVHRDFMPRNLMAPQPTTLACTDHSPALGLGVLDFQDAVYGPITYDIASLMRDAFVSWEEDFVLDITVRYWQKACKAGLMGAASASGWGADFGEFYRAVEWMGLQRHLKVAGIFARLTLRDGKPKYLADTPRFMGYIRATASRYRELTPLLRLLDKVEGTQAEVGFAYGRM